ncbi:MAG: sugar ABC transporter permease, partial [Spirochaetales bacterium]|nr:sugar ABC transporter permease [Spirochaetales bacterium]
MNTKNNRDLLISIGMVAPAMILYLLFQIGPLLGGFYYSLTDWNGISRDHNFIGIQNYITLVKDTGVIVPLKNTFFYAFWSMLLLNVLALAFAVGLNQEIKARNFLRACLFLPAMLAPLVVGYVFSFIFSEPIAALGKTLDIEVLANNMLGSLDWSLTCVVIGTTWRMTGWYMVVYLAGLQTIPGELYEAADIDGSGIWSRFFHIT